MKKEEKENEENEKEKNQIKKNKDMWYLVEDSSPEVKYILKNQFTIKGKYDKGFLNAQENYDDPGKMYGLEGSVSSLAKKVAKGLNPLPKYNSVKPTLPFYSFSEAARFKEEPMQYVPVQQMLSFPDGKFIPEDRKDTCIMQTQ